MSRKMSSHLFRIWDPLYGLLELSPFEERFIFSPEVQRLRHVRLCNIDSLLIPGAAQVSRFEHALGVLRLANEWIATHAASTDEANNLRAAAIVHDMQSGPFGHSIQYILEDNKIGDNFSHEDLAGARNKLFHQDIRANTAYQGELFNVQALCGRNWKQVSDLISGKGRLGKLISGEIDLDNIDNVIRLAFHAGLCDQGERNLPIELARNISLSSSGLTLAVDKVFLISRWQQIRKRLYEFLLLDWAEFSAKAMLTRAFEEAVRLEKLGVDNWRMTDDELIQYFLSQVGDAQSIKELSRKLRLGQLFLPVIIGRSPSIEAYKRLNQIEIKREIERRIRKSVFKDHTGPQILIHFILDVKKTERSVHVFLNETDKSTTIGKDSNCLLVGVFTSKRVSAREFEMLQMEASRILSRYGCKKVVATNDPLIEERQPDDQLGLL